MAVFEYDDPDLGLDWWILRNGWSCLLRQPEVLEQCVAWFERAGYPVVEFDCRRWSDEEAMHVELAAKLSFPSYYGCNLNALNDCLKSKKLDEPGLVLAFRNYEAMPADIYPLPYELLDVLADCSRMHLIYGRRLLALVQISNEDTYFERVGGGVVMWLGLSGELPEHWRVS